MSFPIKDIDDNKQGEEREKEKEKEEQKEKEKEKDKDKDKEDKEKDKEKDRVIVRDNIIDNDIYKEREREKDETDEKFRTLFRKIKTFDQLKREVYDIKTSYEKTAQEVNDYKEKYDYILKKFSTFSKNKGGTSFEQIEDEKNYKNYLSDKLSEIDKKFKIILGDMNIDEEDNMNIINNVSSKDVRDTHHKSNNKSDKDKKNRILNLLEINRRLTQLNLSKLNAQDFDSKAEIYLKKINEVDIKVNELISNLFGEKIENVEEFKNKKHITFVSKNEFEKHKTQNDEEFNKIWEEINNLKKQYDEMYKNLNNKSTLTDLETMKDLILQKMEELFMNQNKKLTNNSYLVQNLQEHFKKLLELLTVREEQEKENWLIAKKPVAGFSCASCESFIGDLKNDKNKYIHWNKLPFREKESSGEKFFRVGNGYSRLLQMVNFDNNGNITLNPFANLNENNNTNHNNSSIISNNSENNRSNNLNRSASRERCKSTKTKKGSKEKSKTIDILKSKNEENKAERKLPLIKCSMSTDNFEKVVESTNLNNQNNGGGGINTSLNFKSPKINKILKKSQYKI